MQNTTPMTLGNMRANGVQTLAAGCLKECNMSLLTDEYRKQAERCRKNAEGSSKQEDRAFWLLLAANWLKLAQDCDETSVTGLRDAG
jgi:hypothetical protein